MSTMVERSEMPEHIDATSRKIVNSLAVMRAEMGCWSYDDMSKIVAEALLAAEKRGKEEAAKIAEGNSTDFDFQKALAEFRDSEHGFHSGRLHAAAAIRGS